MKKQLKKAKIQNVGLFEGLHLKMRGRLDSKKWLPCEDETGNWTSPFIQKDIDSYEEFSAKKFAELQVEQSKKFSRLAQLVDLIKEVKCQIDSKQAQLNLLESNANVEYKHGESKLTQKQVLTRRQRELSKLKAPVVFEIVKLQEQLNAFTTEFFQLQSEIETDSNSVKLLCAKVKKHLSKRLLVYWDSAFKQKSESTPMPVLPKVDLNCDFAEQTYTNTHCSLMQKVNSLNKLLLQTENDKE